MKIPPLIQKVASKFNLDVLPYSREGDMSFVIVDKTRNKPPGVGNWAGTPYYERVYLEYMQDGHIDGWMIQRNETPLDWPRFTAQKDMPKWAKTFKL